MALFNHWVRQKVPAGSHLHQTAGQANTADIPCSGGLAKQLRKHGKASRLPAPAALAALQPSSHPELPRQCAHRDRRAVSHMRPLLSSRYEEERLKARRERSVQSGPVGRVGAGAELGLHVGAARGFGSVGTDVTPEALLFSRGLGVRPQFKSRFPHLVTEGH